jgi:hypothetical protein
MSVGAYLRVGAEVGGVGASYSKIGGQSTFSKGEKVI